MIKVEATCSCYCCRDHFVFASYEAAEAAFERAKEGDASKVCDEEGNDLGHIALDDGFTVVKG